ncbi:MAG: penicillin acylase family protein [Acidimicrobiia bacterium]|nr:penicillin acylase family protein [Acidimicrobiia bacterium]
MIARALLRAAGRRLPRLDGRVPAAVRAAVEIRRDRFGVPNIAAATDEDAWFALGFCQGQDRAFQIETRARVVRGTVAALIGVDGVAIDRLSRRIGFARYGTAALAALKADDRARLEAFAAGVNAGMDAGGGGRSHEFLLLRVRPTRFTASDALGFLAVQSFALASNWDVELARLRMLALDGPAAVADLHPSYPARHPASDRPGAPALRVIDALAEDLAAAGHLFAPGGGSNNWAIAGSRTTSGRPILGNDPHLAPMLPPHWYLARISTPEWSLCGAAVPATPVFGVGHNDHVAWGVTAGLIDDTDLFVETVEGAAVRRDGRLVACETRIETITVRGGSDETITVMVTDRGPIVGPAFDGPFGALSLAATWLRPGPGLGAALHLGRVRTFTDLQYRFREWPTVALNVAYAGPDGIGWQLVGEAPIRGRGGGTIPQDASDPATAWHPRRIPAAELPAVSNPDSGFVATANNLPASDHYLGSDFLDGYRVARITELLAARRNWDVAAVLRMQLDQQSLPWREMRSRVLAAISGEEAPAAVLLRAWDGRVTADSAGAAVFEVFAAHLACRIAERRAPHSARYALGTGFTPLVPMTGLAVRRFSHLVDLVLAQPEGWFDDGWDAAIAESVRHAGAVLTTRAGSDPARWAWGAVRPLRLRHPLGARPVLAAIYDLGPFSHGGDANTLNPAPVNPLDPLANPDFAIASLRFAVEVGAWQHARFALPGGQSGNPYSPHYADQVDLWLRGDGLTIAVTPADVHRTTRHTLILEPAPS